MMNYIKNILIQGIKSLTTFDIFIFFSLSGIITFFLYAFFAGASAYDWLFMDNNGGFSFLDYFMHINFGAVPEFTYDMAEGAAGCFPPLAYIMYTALYRLTAVPGVLPETMIDARDTEYAMPVFVYYSIFVSVLLLLGISLWIQDRVRCLLVYICLMFSVPLYAGGMERGNSTILIMALLLIALQLRSSDRAAARETALFLIAVSAGFKIYPAVFGLLYLKEKRFPEAIRLTIYGILLFFLPFYQYGKMHGFLLWLDNISVTLGFIIPGRIQYIKGLVYTLTSILIGYPIISLAEISPYLLFFLCVILAWLSKSQFRSVFFLCSIMVFFPTNAYRYTLSYFCIPLILLLCEKDERSARARNYISAALLGMLFTIPTYWGMLTNFTLSYPFESLTYVEAWIYGISYMLLFYLIIVEIRQLLSKKVKQPLSSDSCNR